MSFIAAASAGGAGGVSGILIAVAGVAGAVIAAAITYLTGRRVNSGKISTSPAEVIFAQLQHMLDLAETRAGKAEDQRDKLIESQGASIGPSLSEISSGLDMLADMTKALLITTQRVEDQLSKTTGRAHANNRASETGPRNDH